MASAKATQPAVTGGHFQGEHHITVKAVVRPEPDMRKYVKAVVRAAQLERV